MHSSSGNQIDFDVVIVGGGMVGSMVAALLARYTDLSIAVLEQRRPDAFECGSTPDYDIRVSALSIATQNMFKKVGAWQGVLDRRACLYREMLVWDGEESGQTHFKADDIGACALGHIVENRVVQLALLDVLDHSDNVDYRSGVRLQRYVQGADAITLVTAPQSSALDDNSDEQTLRTRLLIGADGARSSVRELANIAMHTDSYEHHALVATVTTASQQQDITWQRFMPTGPQALLPLCGSRASMVWYHNAEEISRLSALDDSSFLHEMMDSFPDRLGELTSVLQRGSFPIVKAHANTYIANRIALVGDAAHTVHPLAGQGLNLGMLDAASLAELVADAHAQGSDIGTRRLLRRYERWRRGDNAIMITALDGFYHAFKPQPQPFRKLRSTALSIADNAGPVKKLIMKYAMGTSGDLPRYAK